MGWPKAESGKLPDKEYYVSGRVGVANYSLLWLVNWHARQ